MAFGNGETNHTATKSRALHSHKHNEKSLPSSTVSPEDHSPFFQPKLTIHPANDTYEIEANHMAERILSMPKAEPSAPSLIQRQSEQEESVQEKTLIDEISPIRGEKSQVSEPQRKPAFFSPSELEMNSFNGGDVQMQSPGNLLSDVQAQREEEEKLQTDLEGSVQGKQAQQHASSGLERDLKNSKGGGQALAGPSQSRMERGFGADFSGVRIHTGARAIQMNQTIGAHAFTHGNDIYFNQGRYRPGTPKGDRLLAHELTHTIQQGAIQRKSIQMQSAGFEEVQASFIRDIIDSLVDLASTVGVDIPRIVDNIPGYTLFSFVIEYDIIRGRTVERNARSLIRGLMGLIPGGNLLYNKLEELGIIDQAFEWVENQLSSLNITMNRVERTVQAAWDDMGITLGIGGNLRVIRNKFAPLLTDITTFASNASDQLLEFVKDALIRPMVDFLEERSDAVKLAYKVLGKRFPLDDEVDAPTVEILEDFLILIGRQTEVDQMKERGTLQETADWIDTQINRFFSLVGRFQAIMTRVWDAFSIDTLSDIPGTFQGIFDDFLELLSDFFDFALEVAEKVLEFVKKALLDWLNSFAADIPGFTLLTVILGKNPLTDEEVPRSVENLIRGFMGLVPGGEAKFQELKESGVIPRAAGQIEALIDELGISWGFIKGLFSGIWDSLSIEDLLNPIAAFQRIAAEFGEPISRLFTFVVKVVRILIELILEIMGIPPDLIGSIITNAMSAFEDIKNDPIGFLLNLMNAVKEGFINFLNNIGTHLLNGLQNWLFGTLADAGIQIPADLSLQSILGMAMEVLGITVDNILDRLALKIGEERVAQIRQVLDTLTGIWAFVRDVMDRGAIAIWEYVESQLSNLWNIIKDGIMGFIQEKVIQQAITWLLSFLDVTGIMPIIRGVQSVYNSVMSFIEKLREILEIVNSFVLGVADIARGNIQSAAQFLENALADGIPVAISFLAKQLGLGDISEKMEEMIEAAREKINEAIDWLIDAAMRAGTAFLGALGLGGGGGEEESSQEEVDDSLEVSESFSEEGHNHTLSIGEHASEELMIASRPTSYTQFLDDLEPTLANDLDPNKPAALARARVIVGRIGSIRAEPNPDQDQTIIANKRQRIRAELLLLWDETTILLAGQDLATGDTREDPISFTWYKNINNSQLYPPITIQGERFDIHDGIQIFEHPQIPGVTIELGIDRSPVESGGYGISEGSVIRRIRGNRGDKADQFRAALEDLEAYIGPFSIEDAAVDIDHVLDVNFGGGDVFSNLWPYDRSANRSAGSRQNSQIITYQDTQSGQLRAVNAGDPILTDKFFFVDTIENA